MTTPQMLTGRRIVVAGGASGIGAAVASVCAAAGADVAVLDLDAAKAKGTAAALSGGEERHVGSACDVSDAASVTASFAEVEARFPQIDGVVNCAGIWRPRTDGPITQVDDDTWNQVISVNLTGTFYVCRAAVGHMEKHGKGGSIVTIASVVAITGWDRLASYTASKGGVLAFSRGLAIECAPKGIRVNCICPGVIETPMTSKVLQYSKPAVLPLGRLGRPEDIAHSAAFLCSDWSSFITAANLVVDGGFSAA